MKKKIENLLNGEYHWRTVIGKETRVWEEVIKEVEEIKELGITCDGFFYDRIIGREIFAIRVTKEQEQELKNKGHIVTEYCSRKDYTKLNRKM